MVFELKPYTTEFNEQINDLVYHTVHNVCGQIYTPEQCEAWAPKSTNKAVWTDRLEDNYSIMALLKKKPTSHTYVLVCGFGSISAEIPVYLQGFVNDLLGFPHSEEPNPAHLSLVCYLSYLYVGYFCQRVGVGSLILTNIEEHAAKEGVRAFITAVPSVAVEFFNAQGYRKLQAPPVNDLSQNIPHYVMGKILPPPPPEKVKRSRYLKQY